MFSDAIVERHGTALDTLAPYLAKNLAFSPKERDLVVLNHDINVQLPGGAQVSLSSKSSLSTFFNRNYIELISLLMAIRMAIRRWHDRSDIRVR